MQVLWKSDLGQGKHDPLEITHVVTKSGSQISAGLVVPLGAVDGHGPAVVRADESAGLLEVIEAQLAAIDEISRELSAAETALELPMLDDGECYIPSHEGHEALQEWADQFSDRIADLCVALGYAAHPMVSTGIPELDILVELSR